MDQNYINSIAELGVTLTTMAVKGVSTAINARIRSIKNEKDVDKIRNVYDSIVNELIAEREEAIRIAQVYKVELDRIVISDEDIKHLHGTVSNLLELLKKISPNTDITVFENFKNLITVDTLKTMQLLGFNYKEAIGQPLTQLCAKSISNIGIDKKKKRN